MTTHEQLEHLAIDAHARGAGWTAWWPTVAEQVRQAEPYDRGRYRRLVVRLLSLLVSGDVNGMMAIGDDDVMPWVIDDVVTPMTDDAKPADVGTAARIDWRAAGVHDATGQDRRGGGG